MHNSNDLSIAEALTAIPFLSTNFVYTVPSLGTINQRFIFEVLTATAHTFQTCGVACFARSLSTSSCHFFILDGSTCLLGNFFADSTYTNTAALTAYLNEGESYKHKTLELSFFELMRGIDIT